MKVELKNKIVLGLWLTLALGVLVLLVFSMQKRKNSFCSGSVVNINGSNQNYFITQSEVEAIVNFDGDIRQKSLKNISLTKIGDLLKRNLWISNADLYFDNNNHLCVNIEQRQPIARLFTIYGNSAYLDKQGVRLPIKSGASARVLAITGFPSNNSVLAKTDSALLENAIVIANYIVADTFLNAQIAEVNIDNKGKFELIPTIGNHVIMLGDTTALMQKFNKLVLFYKSAWLKNGVDIYEKLDLRFAGQIVATKRNLIKASNPDSVRVNAFDSTRLVSLAEH